MKPLIGIVVWLTLTFSLVTMADPSVPRIISLLSKSPTDPLYQQIAHNNSHLKSTDANPDTNDNLSMDPSTGSIANQQKCPACQQRMENKKRPKRLKRSAMLLNKIVSALHKAMDNKNSRSNRIYLDSFQSSLTSNQQMDLTRRTGSKKMFRKCYFNPVACF